MKLSSAISIFCAHSVANAFTVVPHNRHPSAASFITRTSTIRSRPVSCLNAECESRDGKDPSPDDDKEDEKKNPYELEFIDYDDPNYVTDQGLVEGEENYVLSKDKTEEEIEEMREERRVQNDIFQFNTYYSKFLQDREWKGHWTEYRTSTFLDSFPENEKLDANGIPKFVRGKIPLKVTSTGKKVILEPWGPENEVIQHSQVDESSNQSITPFAPTSMRSFDFRGQQGNMCVGNAYTICDAVKIDRNSEGEEHDGPFSELRVEVGIHSEGSCMRLKLDYITKEDEMVLSETPTLHLRGFTMCREREGEFPDMNDEFLFGQPGAPGGLYDPPLIANEEQTYQYITLNLEGYTTVLFPHAIEQDINAFDGQGWVVSLDWTPGKYRYQVDRKFLSGAKIKGLKTLELSEVQSGDADRWRPNDGPTDMRQ